ncbi:MAG TPA: hypothetical protein VF062_29785 [Candidatus Limnocylindrales bacterium]
MTSGTALAEESAGATTVQPLRPTRAWSGWLVFLTSFTGFCTLLLIRSHDLFTRVVYEEGDLAANSILTLQAKHFELLVGNYSRMGFSHPGPGFMYVQAFGEWLFHDVVGIVPSPWNGQAVAILVMNAFFLAATVLVISAWLRSWTAVAVPSGTILAYLALSDMLIQHPDPGNTLVASTWMPDAYFAPFLLLIVAATSLAAGRAQDLWAVAISGGLLVHGHAEFLFFVPVIVLTAFAALFIGNRIRTGSLRSGGKRDWLVFSGIIAVFALPMVLNLILNWPGEFAGYLTYGGHNEPHPAREAIRYTLLFWAMPRKLGLALAAGLILIVVAMALRLGRRVPILWTGAAMAVVVSGLFAFYAKVGIDLLGETYIGQFYRAVPLLLWLLVGVGLCALLEQVRLRAVVWGFAAVVLAFGLVAGATSPALVNRRLNFPEMPTVLAALEGRAGDRVIVLNLRQSFAWAEAVPIVITGTRQGRRVCLEQPEYEYLVTPRFVCTADEVSGGERFIVSRRDDLPANPKVFARLGPSDVLLP